MVSPQRRRAAARHLGGCETRHPQREGLRSQRRACALVGVSRSSSSYRPRRRSDEEALRARIKQLARAKSYYGSRRIWVELRREGWAVNHKRVHRLWKDQGLSVPWKSGGKRSYGPKGEVEQRATHADQVWSYDL
jgi:putative transposase